MWSCCLTVCIVLRGCVEGVCYLWSVRTDDGSRWLHHVGIVLVPIGPSDGNRGW